MKVNERIKRELLMTGTGISHYSLETGLSHYAWSAVITNSTESTPRLTPYTLNVWGKPIHSHIS